MTTKLLEELNALPHAARTTRMVEIGKRDPTVVAELYRSHGHQGKLLALLSCYGSRSCDLALEAIKCSSHTLRSDYSIMRGSMGGSSPTNVRLEQK